MSPLILIGTILGVIIVLAYLITAFKQKANPTLESGVHILLSALGLMGAVRIVGFVLCGSFSNLVKDQHLNQGAFAVSEEDAVSFVIAALALAWVSVKLLAKPFQELKPRKP